MRFKTRIASILKLFILVVLQLSFIVHTDTLESTGNNCGIPKVGPLLIFGGSEISKGAYPWNAVLERIEDGQLFCGATLISSTAVVTAAHCIEGKDYEYEFKKSELHVVLGLHNLSKKHEVERRTYEVRKINVHPDWDITSYSFDADIAVLKLRNQVEFTAYIQPICLLEPQSAAITIKQSIIVGFGSTESVTISDLVKEIKSPIHSYRTCINSNYILEDMMSFRTFCSGNANGTGVCSGDAGSGIYVYHNQQYYLRGIVSTSLLNDNLECDLNSYSVSTDVPKFYDWIQGLNVLGIENKMEEIKDCGEVNKGLPVIVNAEGFIRRHEFPWNAALVLNNGKQICGGTLISKKFVLTASHCVLSKGRDYEFNAGDFVVVLGAHDLSKSIEAGKVVAAVKKIHIHPEWNIHTSTYDADITLLELEHEVTFSNNIKPICVARPRSVEASVNVGVVVGFGVTESRSTSNIAKKLSMPIVNFHDCSVSEKHKDLITPRTICGGSANGSGVCSGDSGSGLYVLQDGKYYIRGIVSMALLDEGGECNVNTYSLFTDIVEFYPWIISGGKNKYFTG